MKNILRLILLLIFIFIGCSLRAQEVNVDNITYNIKDNFIYKDGVNVTKKLNAEQKLKILTTYKRSFSKNEAKKVDALEKAKKEQQKAEKKHKKAEKALKAELKAQTNFNKADKKHEVALKKYQKLKTKGKLSPIKDEQWLKKIDKLHQKKVKAKNRL